MIRHAWSVLCEKHIVDSETNNISLDVIEQMSGTVALPPGARGERVLLPTGLRLVSLWYRRESDPERTTGRIGFAAPTGEVLGQFDVPLDLTLARARTIALLEAIPYIGPGVYEYVVSLEEGDTFREVARIPLEIRLTLVSTPAAAT